ncbi:MAG: class I SAM-dependent methyltransferase [Candidatus Lokiarchaeota archaeon]|nr:class I SAM-dependent methyltransferase [Candidatus Lokiarchaeota archaeon]
MNLLYEIFSDLPRQGPGDPESTEKAFSFIKNLPPDLHIIDVGCGTGQQTLELAKLTNSKVIGLDNYQPFLDELKRKADIQGLSNRIEILNQSMFEMNFESNYFDIIWSEGAVYIYGFEKALGDWRKLLKKKGYFVVSEICWFKENPPIELSKFWKNECPFMKSIEENIKMIESKGFNLISHFKLPESSWWEYLYTPLEANIKKLLEKYKGKEDEINQINEVVNEIDMFRKYSPYYGYTFFIMQKN